MSLRAYHLQREKSGSIWDEQSPLPNHCQAWPPSLAVGWTSILGFRRDKASRQAGGDERFPLSAE